jgi:hypothetical protein
MSTKRTKTARTAVHGNRRRPVAKNVARAHKWNGPRIPAHRHLPDLFKSLVSRTAVRLLNEIQHVIQRANGRRLRNERQKSGASAGAPQGCCRRGRPVRCRPCRELPYPPRSKIFRVSPLPDEGASRRFWLHRRSVPVTTISTFRLPHLPQTSRACQSGTVVSAPYRSAISAGSGSASCRQSLHQTIKRTRA